MHHKLIITVLAALKVISWIFLGFLVTKTNNFSNYVLSKSKNRQTANVAVLGGFWAFLGCFWAVLVAIFLNLAIFTLLA